METEELIEVPNSSVGVFSNRLLSELSVKKNFEPQERISFSHRWLEFMDERKSISKKRNSEMSVSIGGNDNDVITVQPWVERFDSIISPNTFWWTWNKESNNLVSDALNRLDRDVEFIKNDFEEDGIDLPNDFVRDSFKMLFRNIYQIEVNSFRVGASSEEGVIIEFSNNDLTLVVELYNTQEFAFVISNRLEKKVLSSGDPVNIAETIEIVKQFYLNDGVPK